LQERRAPASLVEDSERDLTLRKIQRYLNDAYAGYVPSRSLRNATDLIGGPTEPLISMAHLISVGTPLQTRAPRDQNATWTHATPSAASIKEPSAFDDATHADPLSAFAFHHDVETSTTMSRDQSKYHHGADCSDQAEHSRTEKTHGCES